MSKKKKTGIFRLIEIARSKKWWLIFSMLIAVFASILQFIPIIAIYNILKELAAHATNPQLIDKDFIWNWGIIALVAIIAFGLFLFVSTMFSHIAAFNILYEIRMSLARKLVKLPLGFFTKRTSGEIKKIMSEDVERIELFVAHHIPDITCAIVFPLLTMGYLFYSDWRLALIVFLVYLISLAIISTFTSRNAIQERIKYQETLGQMNNSIVEYVRGIQVVKVFNRSTNAFERLQKNINDFRDFSVKITKLYAPGYLSFYTIISSVLLFLIPTSVFFLINSSNYPSYLPTVLLFLLLGGNIFFPMLKLMWIGGLISNNSIGIGLIDEILDKPEINNPLNPQEPKNSSVEFCNVKFSYDKTSVLKGISFKSSPGTVTALVGPSGAGKSTVAMLTARFWDVDDGEILIGGIPIKNIENSKLMDFISFVFQDNMLFFDTIEENIRMGNKTASFDDVIRAAKAAQCHEFIEKLDKGYQTLVGEGGTYLSGGEQQRIALARAILKNSPIILLDEATAYADPENEGKILDTFSYLIKGKTVIVIAHRLSTITNADQILLFDKGIIAEQGKHDELLKMNGQYAHMWSTYNQSREWIIERKEEKQ